MKSQDVDKPDVENWGVAVKAWQENEEKQLEFLSSAAFLHPVRHVQFDRPIKMGMLKSRLEFLRLVLADLG